MALLRPKNQRKKSILRASTVLTCPYNGHQVSMCLRLCEPDGEYGHCGRLAPHKMIGRTQAAIMNYKAKPLKY